MARTYARVKTAVWADDEFRGLPPDAQHLYFVLLTSAGLSYCGVTDWRPVRIAPNAHEWSALEVERAAWILHERLYIVVHGDTEEVLIRSFVRNDGFMDQPNVAAAMVRDYARISSPILRGVVVHELLRLHKEQPQLKGWVRAESLLGNPSVNPSGNPTGWGPPNPTVGVPVGVNGTPRETHAPLHTPSPTPSPSSPSDTPRSARKRHIPDDWQPNDKHRDLATQLELDLTTEVERFRDYDKAKGPIWKDFDAAFNNWLRNNARWGKSPRNPYSRQQETDELFNAAMDRAVANGSQELTS